MINISLFHGSKELAITTNHKGAIFDSLSSYSALSAILDDYVLYRNCGKSNIVPARVLRRLSNLFADGWTLDPHETYINSKKL